MEPFVTPVEGENVHNMFGVSDERFKQLNETVNTLFEEHSNIATMMAAIANWGETPGEKVLAIFQAGRKYECRQAQIAEQHEEMMEEAKESLESLLGAIAGRRQPRTLGDLLAAMSGATRRPSLADMLSEALGGGGGRAGGISLEDVLGDECPVHGSDCPNRGKKGHGVAAIRMTPNGAELVNPEGIPEHVRDILQGIVDAKNAKMKQEAPAENGANPQ